MKLNTGIVLVIAQAASIAASAHSSNAHLNKRISPQYNGYAGCDKQAGGNYYAWWSCKDGAPTQDAWSKGDPWCWVTDAAGDDYAACNPDTASNSIPIGKCAPDDWKHGGCGP